MCSRATRATFATICVTFALAAQQPADDAALAKAHAAWSEKQQAYTQAAVNARKDGLVKKGGALPPEVEKLQKVADAERDALLDTFGKRDDLTAASFLLLARVHETARDYRAAVGAYERCLARGDAKRPDTSVMHSLCIAAMNSKDDRLAASWMKKLIAVEDHEPGARRELSVRTSYYPRTLIALGVWQALEAHLDPLAKDDAPAARAAATTFRTVAKIHSGDVEGAEKLVAALRADPKTYPDHQAWAVLVELALAARRGEFDEGARRVREFLAAGVPEGASGSAVDKNQRGYLRAIEPFLGKPAPGLRVDRWVGGEVAGADVLATLKGKVVLLDFWQPWCEPCRNAMPHLIALQKAHPDDVQVLGLCKIEDWGYDVSEKKAVRKIAKDDYAAHVADFRADMKINYPLAIADTPANSEAYRVSGIPTLVVIDRAGIVRYMSCGAGEPGLLELAVAGVIGKR